MNTKPPTPRLFVLVAREAPYAVILRRDPSKQACSYGWNLETDEIVMGQWLKGRFYEHRCDLSPDGKHLIYFAANWKPPHRSWTALSRAPWITALDLDPVGSTWHGGGLFLDNRTYWLHSGGESRDMETKTSKLTGQGAERPFGKGIDSCVVEARLWLAGWRPVEDPDWHAAETMKLTHESGISLFMRIGLFHGADRFYIRTGEATGWQEIERATWADIISGSLCFTRDGCLFKLPLADLPGLDAAGLVRDFCSDVFEERAAPYTGVSPS